ncbi:MAG TPA: hypothetical protein VGQ52_16990 [Gemmatimonadaceae bacterium]|nr:hypothetical protein [Gemmatimonadaceae bacterium]
MATAALLLQAAVVACARYEASASTDSAHADSAARATQDSINRAQPGYIVDSIFPSEEEIRRFNAGLARPTALNGGAASRAELVRLFAAALRRADTAALRDLLVSRAEFGHFVFPESPFTRPPYKTKPIVIWTQLLGESTSGLERLLKNVSGDSMRISQLACDGAADREGANRYWRNCTVVLESPDGTARRIHLFGHIMERGGRFKFLSYSTDF